MPTISPQLLLNVLKKKVRNWIIKMLCPKIIWEGKQSKILSFKFWQFFPLDSQVMTSINRYLKFSGKTATALSCNFPVQIPCSSVCGFLFLHKFFVIRF